MNNQINTWVLIEDLKRLLTLNERKNRLAWQDKTSAMQQVEIDEAEIILSRAICFIREMEMSCASVY